MKTPHRLALSRETLEEVGRLLNEHPGGECCAWLDKATGEVITTTSMYGLGPAPYEAEDAGWNEEDTGWSEGDTDWNDEPPDDRSPPEHAPHELPGWMEDERRLVEAICADTTGRYLPVPVGAAFGAPGILDAFADTLTDRRLREEIGRVMRGPGAFRRVKDTLQRRGKLELWQDYEERRQLSCAREWLREEGIAPIEEPPALRLVGEAEDN